MTRRMKKAALNLLLAGLSTVACLAAIEVVFYFLNRQTDQDELPGPQAELARFFRYHPVLGHDGLPGVRGTFRRKAVTHNSRGSRGPEVPFEKPAGVARILVLGDSQAWGYGVADDETIAAQLGTLLAAEPAGDRRPEVVNLGVSGYGTDQAFLKFLIDGLRYSPDDAVFVVFKNDLVENATTRYWGIEKPRLFVKDGELCLGNVPPRKAPGWPEDRLAAEGSHLVRIPLLGAVDLERSQTFRFFARRQWRRSLLGGRAQADLEAVRVHLPCVENRETYPGDGEEILVRVFLRLQTICRSRQVGLTVLFVPRPREVETPDAPAYYEKIKTVFDREGIRSVDLRAHALRRGLSTDELFGTGDAHLSAQGSRVAAHALRDALRGR